MIEVTREYKWLKRSNQKITELPVGSRLGCLTENGVCLDGYIAVDSEGQVYERADNPNPSSILFEFKQHQREDKLERIFNE